MDITRSWNLIEITCGTEDLDDQLGYLTSSERRLEGSATSCHDAP